MSEFDAEWFNPEDLIPRRLKPKTTTIKPRRRRPLSPIPDTIPKYSPRGLYPNRPRKPAVHPPRRRPHDEADTLEPNTLSTGAVASISVISSLVVVAGILVLLYFTVVRKKITKKKNTCVKNDFSIRVEDVAHINIEESSNIYVNTEDLQRLVKSIRQKPKERVPHVNNAFLTTSASLIKTESNNDDKPIAPPCTIKKNKNLNSKPSAPPCTVKKNEHFNGKPSAPPFMVDYDESREVNNINLVPNLTSPVRSAPLPPPVKNKIGKPSIHEHQDNSLSHASSKELLVPKSKDGKKNKQSPCPPIMPKPIVPMKDPLNLKKTNAVPKHTNHTKSTVLPVPGMRNNKPLSPPLKTNLFASPNERQVLNNTPETNVDSEPNPEMMSLSQKMAFWESSKTNQ